MSRRRAAPPSVEEISARAYQRFLDRGGAEGSPEADWYAAEAELANRKRR